MATLEQQHSRYEFEQNMPREVERKFIPVFPEQLDIYRQTAWPIEQFYLSHPSEPFSLRMREELIDGELSYTATLKDTGHHAAQGIDRMEVTTSISAELYQYYRSPDTPVLRKLRAEPLPGVTIDFYEDGSVQIESESPANWSEFTAIHHDQFVEVTGDHSSTNEWKAHLSFRRAHEGAEAFVPQDELDPRSIATDILRAQTINNPVTVHIAGRSGSGKSTIVRELEAELSELGIGSCTLSTDNYHRGTTWLTRYNDGMPWTKWDDAIVYDTAAMAIDLAELRAGRSVWHRWIDFSDGEPKIDGVTQPAPVIIIEGIYASSPDIITDGDLSYEMTTSIATCVGRRLLRDMRERPEFADPEKSLNYMLSEAEPAYRRQQQ